MMTPLPFGTCEHFKLKFANGPVWDIVVGNREKLWEGRSPKSPERDPRDASGEFSDIQWAFGGDWISPR